MNSAIVILILTYCNAVSAEGYYSSNQNLVNIPEGIPNETTYLDLRNNIIEAIESFPQLPVVITLKLENNLLEEFPNLENISTTIAEIHLDDNRISLVRAERLAALTSIERIHLKRNRITIFPQVDTLTTILYLYLDGNPLKGVPRLGKFGESLVWLLMEGCGIDRLDPIAMSNLKKLNVLSLASNNLTTLPDVSSSPSTFIQMTISNNPIREIARDDLMKMPQLRLLKVDNMLFRRLPNFCHTPLNGFIEDGTSFPVHCDCHAQWLKIGMAANFRIIGASPTCVSPPHLVGLPWNMVNMSDMVCTGE